MLEFYVFPFKQLPKGLGHFLGSISGVVGCLLPSKSGTCISRFVTFVLFFFFPDVAEAQTVRLFLCPIWIYCSGAPIHRSFWQFFLFSDSSDYHSGPRRNPKLTQRSSGYGPNMVAVPTRSWESEKKHLESCRLFFFGTKKNNTPSEARPRLSA